ncbi:transposase, partial [Vibrio rotiferianus]
HAKMKALFQWLAEQDIKLPQSLVAELLSIHAHYKYLNEQVSIQDRKLKAINENAELLKSIPGIGDLTATLCVANISSPSNFGGGREMAAWLGLVPRQYS